MGTGVGKLEGSLRAGRSLLSFFFPVLLDAKINGKEMHPSDAHVKACFLKLENNDMNILLQDLKCAWHTNELKTTPVPQGAFSLTPKDDRRTGKVAGHIKCCYARKKDFLKKENGMLLLCIATDI